jgi:hypothetical protein
VDAVVILRELSRSRILVTVAAVFAIAVGGLTAYSPGIPPKSRQYEIGIASARALVDTPSSQVVDLGPKEDANVGVLPSRTVLLANLLTTSPLRDQIAERAGVRLDRLIVHAETPAGGIPVSAPAATGAKLSPEDPRINLITLQTDVTQPLLTVDTQAPDAPTAAKLADSTLEVLERHLESLVTDEQVPESRQLVLERLGSASAATEQRGPSRPLALVVVLVLFGLGCAAIVIGGALARDWRTAAALDRGPRDWFGDAAGPDPAGDSEDEGDDEDGDAERGARRGPNRIVA